MSPLIATCYSDQSRAELGDGNCEQFDPLIGQLRQEVAARARTTGRS